MYYVGAGVTVHDITDGSLLAMSSFSRNQNWQNGPEYVLSKAVMRSDD